MNDKINILLLGDSTIVHITDRITSQLSDTANVIVSPSVRHSHNFIENLDNWMQTTEPTIVYFNCGLHDLSRDRATHEFTHYQTTNQQEVLRLYSSNLNSIINRLEKEVAIQHIIWGTITPVIDQWHHEKKTFDRQESDVVSFNETALKVAHTRGLLVHDRHQAVVDADIKQCLRPDGVHMTPQGLDILATSTVHAIHDVISQ